MLQLRCSFKKLIGYSEPTDYFKTLKPFTTTTSLNSPQFNLHYPMDSSAYTKLIQSSLSKKSLIKGKSIHAHMIKSHFNPCIFLQNNLLNLYCECGNMALARRLFDATPHRNTVSWNSLISGHVKMNYFDKAMHSFVEARNSNLKLDRFTYAVALSICSRTGDLGSGKMIHGMVMVIGLSKLAFLTNSLIDMYSRCGRLDEARRVFDRSGELDDVSWNSLISAHVRIGLVDETLKIFARMRQVGVKMNSFVLGSILKSCLSLKGSMEIVELVHCCVVKVGLDSDVFVGSAMLNVYARNGTLNEALEVFKLIEDPNVVVFNAMIAGFCRFEMDKRNDLTNKALSLFREMQRRGMRPSKFSFSSVLRACNLSKAFEFGKQVHGQLFKNNHLADEFVGSALIDLYCNANLLKDGLMCFSSLSKHDIVTWTSMISGCVQNEQFERALSLFYELLRIGRKPDQFTISSVLSACANLAVARSGKQIQSYAVKSGFDGLTICNNSLVFMYSRSGDIDAAVRAFEETECRDVVSWSAMISSHAQHGCARDALLLFEEMEDQCIVPNQVTFLGVLTACSHVGLVDEGFKYFDSMKRDYGMNPNVKHCACMVDLLGRARMLAEAEDFILDSGFDTDPVMWRALLGSCRVHKDIERGARVAERVMELEPEASASYVLLYNMYLNSGRRSLAMKTRDRMIEQGVKKEPGLSWIEIGASVHSFVVGDNSHPQSSAIYANLSKMLLRIENVKELFRY